MANTPKNAQDELLIQSIIYTFRYNFICAIHRNSSDCLSAGQLSACLLEQFSGFLYHAPINQRVEQFIYTYLEPYSDMGLYDILRNSHDERLIERLGAVILNVPGRLLKNGSVGLDRVRIIHGFIHDLEEAVVKAAGDLQKNEQMQRHALVWAKGHPVYLPSWMSLYTETQQDKLVGYYTPILQKQHLFSTGSPFSFYFNFANGGHRVTVRVKNIDGREEARVPLEVFVELLMLKSPEDVLSEAE